jgi:hypothetical protein
MAFEKFFRTKTQEMLDKRKKDVPEVDDKITFIELIEALQLAEDKIIHLEIEVSAKSSRINELEYSKYGGYIGGEIRYKSPEYLGGVDYGFQSQQNAVNGLANNGFVTRTTIGRITSDWGSGGE